MPHTKRFYIFLLIAAGLAYAVYKGSAPFLHSADKNAAKAATVTVVEIQKQPFTETLEALGTARANESTEISAKVTGIVAAVKFTDGMQVRAGDVLLTLSHAEEQARVRQAEANMKEQRQEYDRVVQLSKDKIVSVARLNEQESKLKQAEARLNEVSAQLGDQVIAAPFSGVLGLRMVSKGALIKPGTVITTLDDISTIKLDFTIPETYLSLMQNGQKLEAKSAAFRDKTFAGVITAIDSRVDPATRAVTIRAEIPNPENLLRPGMLLTVSLQSAERQAILVPEGALVPLEDKQYVFVVDAQNKAQRVEVALGRRQPGNVEITSGIKEGNRVVVEGTLRLRPGAAVTVVPSTLAPQSGS